MKKLRVSTYDGMWGEEEYKKMKIRKNKIEKQIEKKTLYEN